MLVIMKCGKIETMERMELPNLESIRTLEKKMKAFVFGNIGSGHNVSNRDDRRNKKRIL